MPTINHEKCDNCGTIHEANAKFCGNCGNQFTSSTREIQQRPITPRLENFTEPAYPPQRSFQTQGTKIYPKQSSKVNIYRIVIAVLVVLLVGAVIYNFVRPGPGQNSIQPVVRTNTPQSTANQATNGVTPTPAVTATSLPVTTVGDVLCQADSVKGWNGWTGSSDWKILNGVLLSDGTNNNSYGPPTIVAPCQLGGIANYAVETKIQVLTNSYPTCFGINVRGTPTSSGWQGYIGTIYRACNNGNDLLALNVDTTVNNNLTNAPFHPGNTFHTYRVEVKDNNIRFLIDGAQLLAATDNRYLSGMQVGLWSYEAQLNVSSFKVIAL